MTSSGFGALKMAVPATMTLLPADQSNDRLGNYVAALTCIGTDINCLGSNTAIDLDVLFWEACAQFRNFRYAPLEEFLAAASCAT
jgi:hypothetical protein